MKKVFVTGSSGLVGSETVLYFENRGWEVHGVDNNMRRDFFGPDGDTQATLNHLLQATKNFTPYDCDIRDRQVILELVRKLRPDLIIHSASQPSHDLAKDRPFDDFEINATGTLNLLEAVRSCCRESPFVFLSTNKVYGDVPNEKELVELETRWDYAHPEDSEGIDENCRIDASLHSLFGASKLAADILVQEYGRNFDMPTVCLRCGCITGPQHSGAELHGFLAYLAKVFKEDREYRIFGYKGKQVRDHIHAYDVCTFMDAFYQQPRTHAIYNLGGGRANSLSILESIGHFERLMDKQLTVKYLEDHRLGDHICYISNLKKVKKDYPEWDISRSITSILEELAR
ncbi:MAG: NAD-dependent epimerase/dehydratase family protein [Acidobacteria bacterium]|nr:NAD-dependent epimerase/dehydratase family protein [Acidobacteriota bacterium]